jgi:hypothetical protein
MRSYKDIILNEGSIEYTVNYDSYDVTTLLLRATACLLEFVRDQLARVVVDKYGCVSNLFFLLYHVKLG